MSDLPERCETVAKLLRDAADQIRHTETERDSARESHEMQQRNTAAFFDENTALRSDLAAANQRIGELTAALATCDAALVGPLRFMDGLDARMAVEVWIEKVARAHADDPRFSIERFGLRFDDPTAQPAGGVTVIWAGTEQIGIATIVRDETNFSVLTIVGAREARRAAKEVR
jgi:hypothetical protein